MEGNAIPEGVTINEKIWHITSNKKFNGSEILSIAKKALKSELGIVIDSNSNYEVLVYSDGKGNYVIIISKTK